LPANRYGIVSGARNRITAVVLAAALLSTLERLDRQREGVSSAALGPDHARRTRINFQLLPQPQYLHVDVAIENIFMDSRRLGHRSVADTAARISARNWIDPKQPAAITFQDKKAAAEQTRRMRQSTSRA